jgi:hypothetical protein
MHAAIFSRGSPTGDVWSDIAQFPVAHARTHPSKEIPSGSRDVWWRHSQWTDRTRANITPLSIAHAHTSPKGNPLRGHVTVCSFPVALVQFGKKKMREKERHAQNIIPVMTSLVVTCRTSFAVAHAITSSSTTTRNASWAVLIYYCHHYILLAIICFFMGSSLDTCSNQHIIPCGHYYILVAIRGSSLHTCSNQNIFR